MIAHRYEGEWATGIKEGKGKFLYANGDEFTVSPHLIKQP